MPNIIPHSGSPLGEVELSQLWPEDTTSLSVSFITKVFENGLFFDHNTHEAWLLTVYCSHSELTLLTSKIYRILLSVMVSGFWWSLKYTVDKYVAFKVKFVRHITTWEKFVWWVHLKKSVTGLLHLLWLYWSSKNKTWDH